MNVKLKQIFPLTWMIAKTESVGFHLDPDDGLSENFMVTLFYDTYPHKNFHRTPGWIGDSND